MRGAIMPMKTTGFVDEPWTHRSIPLSMTKHRTQMLATIINLFYFLYIIFADRTTNRSNNEKRERQKKNNENISDSICICMGYVCVCFFFLF